MCTAQNGAAAGMSVPRPRRRGFVVWLYNTLRDTYDEALPALTVDGHQPGSHGAAFMHLAE